METPLKPGTPGFAQTVPSGPSILTRHQDTELRKHISPEFGPFGPEYQVTSFDIRTFGDLVGDHNPLHFSAEASQRGPFGKPVAHGALIACLLPRIWPDGSFMLVGSEPVNMESRQRNKSPVFHNNRIRARQRLVAVRVAGPMTILKYEFEIWNISTNKLAVEIELTLLYQ